MSSSKAVVFCLLLLVFQGCGRIPAPEPTPAPEPAPEVEPGAEVEAGVMVRVAPASYPRFTDDMNYDGLDQAIGRSVAYLMKLPEDRQFSFGQERFSRNHVLESLQRFLFFIEKNPSTEELNRFLADHYLVYRSRGADGEGRVLFTGYYEPLIAGSLSRSEKYAWPIYGRPSDLVSVDLSLFSDACEGKRIIGRVSSRTLVPYHDRKAIDFGGAVEGKAMPIAWVEDPVDLFFLHVQGSGKISLEDGATRNVHYDTSNGLPYRSIGKALIESGKIPREEMSMQAIREYIKRHPDEAGDIFGSNPSYIFFKFEEGGPYGCLGEAITTGRSLAVDKSIFPMAGLSFVQTTKPVVDENGDISGWEDFTRFMLNQDTGGAIKGPARADIFWGNGSYAEIAAGHLKHDGALFFLVLAPSDSIEQEPDPHPRSDSDGG
jgi:membrane-bound lytic murein transglycosylase A